MVFGSWESSSWLTSSQNVASSLVADMGNPQPVVSARNKSRKAGLTHKDGVRSVVAGALEGTPAANVGTEEASCVIGLQEAERSSVIMMKVWSLYFMIMIILFRFRHNFMQCEFFQDRSVQAHTQTRPIRHVDGRIGIQDKSLIRNIAFIVSIAG